MFKGIKNFLNLKGKNPDDNKKGGQPQEQGSTEKSGNNKGNYEPTRPLTKDERDEINPVPPEQAAQEKKYLLERYHHYRAALSEVQKELFTTIHSEERRKQLRREQAKIVMAIDDIVDQLQERGIEIPKESTFDTIVRDLEDAVARDTEDPSKHRIISYLVEAKSLQTALLSLENKLDEVTKKAQDVRYRASTNKDDTQKELSEISVELLRFVKEKQDLEDKQSILRKQLVGEYEKYRNRENVKVFNRQGDVWEGVPHERRNE